jgi:hypothetical protein
VTHGVEKKSSTEWLKTPGFAGVTVLDPDGWDRRNYEASMAEPITLEEFKHRLSRSSHAVSRRP